MASAALIAQVWVKMQETDGGLGVCFAAARVHDSIIAKFAEEGVESLADFVGYVTASGYEKGAENVRDKVESLKGRSVETARIRTANQIAVKVVEASNAETKETPAQVHLDMEASLQEQKKVSIAEQWTRRYNLHLSMYVDPADSLLNLLYGEFRINIPTLIPVKRIRSIFQGNRQSVEQEHPLPGGISITVEEAPDEVVRDVFAYYCSLRVLANAAAKAGNFEVEQDREGHQDLLRPVGCEFGLCRSCLESHTAATRRAAGDAFVDAREGCLHKGPCDQLDEVWVPAE